MPNTSVTLSPIPRAADHPSRRQRRLLEISNEIAVDKTTWTVISVAGDEALMRLARNDRLAFPIAWGDRLVYHGEDGWCIGGEQRSAFHSRLELYRIRSGYGDRDVFYLKVTTA